MAISNLDAALGRLGHAEDTRARFDTMASPLLVPLYRFARGMARNAEDAEDLVQDTYVNAYKAFGSFRSGTNFKAWMFRICVNLYVDSYRSRQRAPLMMPLMESDVDASPVVNHIASPEVQVMDAVMDEDLEAALNGLPGAFRAVVLLSDMEGLAYEEIAGALSVPIGTVRSRLFRGRNLLRVALGEYGRRHGLVTGAEAAQ